MKAENADKTNEFEQKLIRQADDDNEKFEERVKVLETQHKKSLDYVEKEKNELERHFLSELKTQKAEFASNLKNVDDKHVLKIQAKMDEFAKIKLDLDGKIERHIESIKQQGDELLEQENTFKRNVKQQLMTKEDELRTEFAEVLKANEDTMRSTFQHEMNLMKNDMQFKIDRSKMVAESLDKDLKREREKTHRIGNILFDKHKHNILFFSQ